MPLSRFYLPEAHDFEFIGRAPWPIPQAQIDWVDSLIVMENWLDTHIGPHYKRWAWATVQDHETWEACVAFKYDKHRTLFLLTWVR